MADSEKNSKKNEEKKNKGKQGKGANMKNPQTHEHNGKKEVTIASLNMRKGRRIKAA